MFFLITFLIVCVGGINWFCIGLFQFDIIAGIFGSQAHFVSRFLYVIIGLATICSLIALPIKKGRVYTPKEFKEQQDTEESESEEDLEKEQDSKSNGDDEDAPQEDSSASNSNESKPNQKKKNSKSTAKK